jgi:hypothetical protein
MPPAKAKLGYGLDLSAAWLHGWVARTDEGAGDCPAEVLYDLLEVRIMGWKMPAVRAGCFVPIYAQYEHII